MIYNPLLIYGFEESGGSGSSLWKQDKKTVSVTPRTAIRNGLLYSGNAVIDPRGLAPAGYHLPTRYEQQEMLTYLGGDMGAGGKMKSTDNWDAPNTGATNESGFSAFGGGAYIAGSYMLLGIQARFWTSTVNGTAPYIDIHAMRLYNNSVYGVVYDVTNYLDDACSIRFVKDNDTLGGNIIDQDGNVYHPVKIGNQVWLQENWACTKFANGEAITKGLTDGESWYDYYEAVEANAFYLGAPVTSEVNDPNHIRPKEDDVTVKVEYIDPKVDFWEYESITIPDAIHFGSLYNHAACMDVRGIANVGFRLPTYTEMVNFKDFIGTNNGLDLRDTGAEYWDFNGGATNLHNFNSRGSGMRFEGGNFMLLKNFAAYWTDTENEYFPENAWLLSVNDSSGGVATVVVVNYSKKNASSIRLVKDVTTLANGESGTYTGNDGRVYPTICIDGVEYMAADLCETKFRDGSLIPNVSINAEWAALNSAGMCYYNNVQSNAYTLETIIPDATRIRPIGADVKLRSEYVVGGGAGGSVEYEQIITTTNGTADGDGVITGTVTFNLDPDIDTAKPIKVIDGSLFTKAYTINNAASPKTITMAVAPLAENDLTIYFYKI